MQSSEDGSPSTKRSRPLQTQPHPALAPHVVQYFPDEFFFGFYRYSPGDIIEYPINQYGVVNLQMPTRDEVVQQLTGKHPEFNFQKKHCDWQGAIRNFTKYASTNSAFAIVSTKQKEVLGIITLGSLYSLENWIEKVHFEVKDHIQRIGRFEDTNKVAEFAYSQGYSFNIDYACTGGGFYASNGEGERVKGIMRYMLYWMSYIIEWHYVRPAGTMLFMDQWDQSILSKEKCMLVIRSMCFFTLYGVTSAQPAWRSLGFDELRKIDKDVVGHKDFYKSVYDMRGVIPEAPAPRMMTQEEMKKRDV